MEDLTLWRASLGLCPICCIAVESREGKVSEVEYKGKKILVCDHHVIPESFYADD